MRWLAPALVALAVWVLIHDPREQRLRALTNPNGTFLAAPVATARIKLLVSALTRRNDRQLRVGVVDAAESWAAELRAGRTPADSLVRALRDGPHPFDSLADSIALGAEVPVALAEAANLRGASGLRSLSSCWHVGAESGAALAPTVERVAKALRDDLDRRNEVDAQLAAPRATARLLAVLPLAGPLLGAVMGVSTVDVLLGSNAGRGCLVTGLALTALGFVWTRSLAAAALKAS